MDYFIQYSSAKQKGTYLKRKQILDKNYSFKDGQKETEKEAWQTLHGG